MTLYHTKMFILISNNIFFFLPFKDVLSIETPALLMFDFNLFSVMCFSIIHFQFISLETPLIDWISDLLVLKKSEKMEKIFLTFYSAPFTLFTPLGIMMYCFHFASIYISFGMSSISLIFSSEVPKDLFF